MKTAQRSAGSGKRPGPVAYRATGTAHFLAFVGVVLIHTIRDGGSTRSEKVVAVGCVHAYDKFVNRK